MPDRSRGSRPTRRIVTNRTGRPKKPPGSRGWDDWPPPPDRRAGDEWPPLKGRNPSLQHLPFLGLSVFNELEVIANGYRFTVEVTNDGNAPALQAVVELFLEMWPGESEAVRSQRGFKPLGRIDPHATISTTVNWLPPPRRTSLMIHVPAVADIRRQLAPPIFVGVVYDPVLDPRPDLNSDPPDDTVLRFHVQLVRRPLRNFRVSGGLTPVFEPRRP